MSTIRSYSKQRRCSFDYSNLPFMMYYPNLDTLDNLGNDTAVFKIWEHL